MPNHPPRVVSLPPEGPSTSDSESQAEAFGTDLVAELEAGLDEVTGELSDVRRPTTPEREADDRYVEIGGVMLVRGTGVEDLVPRAREGIINDDLTVELHRRIATAAALHQPVLIEGGNSLDESIVVEDIAARLGWSLHRMNMIGTSDSDDLMGRYTANPERKSKLDPELVFADGPVTAAIREASAGHKVMLLIEEINAAHPNVLIRLHEVIEQYVKSGQIELSDAASEYLDVIRRNITVVATASLPSRGGSSFAGREPLDPAQFRHWVHQKMPDGMTNVGMEQFPRTLSGFEYSKDEFNHDENLPINERRLTREQLIKLEEAKGLEAGCIVVDGASDTTQIMHELMMEHWRAVHDAQSLQKALDEGVNFYWHYHGSSNFKPIYDLICQYHTGNVNLFDSVSGNHVIEKDLKGAFVLIIAQHELDTLTSKGYEVLERVGITEHI